MTVTNGSSAALAGWTVTLPLPAGQTVSSLWSGQSTGTTGNVTVRNASWNGALGVGASTTFGFTVSGGTTAPSGLSCASP
ncbi:cellulose binding domain-containing protein [Streptomyces sp. 4F14]|uniref:cellulose binding domain-containing protein n=1 Tax=Streptomyces sp. 4F14 TaxID=3394380 RepID=UPI003A881F54